LPSLKYHNDKELQRFKGFIWSFVHGKADKMINSRCSAILAERTPGSKFNELPGKGHGTADEAEDLSYVSIILENAVAWKFY
jgi:hypothetical protein